MSALGVVTSPPQPAEHGDTLIPFFPNDIALNILARVPRSHHPVLSQVSRAFKSLLSSPRFFTTRRLVGTAEPWLYLILYSRGGHPYLHCFARSPSEQSGFVETACIPLPTLYRSTYIALGHDLYVLGGSFVPGDSVDDICSQVWILDCRNNTWRRGPSMLVERELPVAVIADGKLYIFGFWGGRGPHSATWAEVLAPSENGSWVPVPSPATMRDAWMERRRIAVLSGKIYAWSDMGVFVFDPRTGGWGKIGRRRNLGWVLGWGDYGRSCVVNGVLYCYDGKKIKGFDEGDGLWRELKGVNHLLPKYSRHVTMADFSGNLMMVWMDGKDWKTYVTEIKVRKESNEYLTGDVQWSGLLPVQPDSRINIDSSVITL